MRWKLPKIGDIKTKILFAFSPVEINGYIVWLEKYKKIYEYKHFKHNGYTRYIDNDEWVLVKKEFLNK